MTKFRVSVLLSLMAVCLCASGYAQDFRTAVYTGAPGDFEEYKFMRAEAAWYQEVFADPATVLKADVDSAVKYLGKPSYEINRLILRGPDFMRSEISRQIVARAQYDPIFGAVLKIAKAETNDRITAIQASQLLVNTLAAYVGPYPGIASHVRDILLDDIESEHFGVRFTAVKGLGYIGSSNSDSEVLAALVGLLSAEEEVLIDAAAAALARIGDKSAVAPLMEAFLSVPEDEDPSVVENEGDLSGERTLGTPLNQARLSIANAVSQIAGLDLVLVSLERKDVLQSYETLTAWWEANKEDY